MGSKHLFVVGIWLLIITVIISCQKLEPAAPADDQTLDGPVDGLSYAQLAQHAAGDKVFTDQNFTAETGLGPIFVATKCASCHAGDGKGHPFVTLTRFGKTDSLGKNEFNHGFQLQDKALPGYQSEKLPPGAPFAKFTAPINSGMGFIELVSEDDILAMAAANANNPDGVKGHPNWNLIPSYVSPNNNSHVQSKRYICRFGKKASVYNLFHQTVVAFNQDIGITTSFDPSDVYSLKDIDPEITDNTVRNVVFYLQTLKAPVQRDINNVQVMNGKEIFIRTGCEACHKQTLKTAYSPVEALSNVQFHPYTDLLLHNMGPGLDDGYTEGSAQTAEWRTAPLWGLGLAPKSQGGQYYLLHDGRARSVDEAIIMHGGEADASRARFTKLSPADHADLLQFLKSL